MAGGAVRLLALLTATSEQVIFLSVLVALVMYVVNLISLFVLRRREPALDRLLVVPGYPAMALVALVLYLLSLAALVYYNLLMSAIFLAALLGLLCVYLVLGGRNSVSSE